MLGFVFSAYPYRQCYISVFLNRLLYEAANKLGAGKKAIIVADALDGVDNLGLSQGANVLHPPILNRHWM